MGVYIWANELKNAYIGERKGFVPGSNTVAYYKFDGNLNDSSGNNRNLSMVTWSFSYSALSSWQKYCQLNTSAYATYNNIPFNRTAYTVSGWCSWNDNLTSSYQKIIFNILAGSSYYPRFWAWWYNHYNKLGSIVSFDSWNTSCENNKWYHLVSVYNNNTASSYINWQLIHSLNYSSSETSWNITINAESSNANYRTNGRISEIILENKARTSDEILAYYSVTKSNYGL